MEAPPAVWMIHPAADRDRVEDLVQRLADRLGIPAPELGDDSVLLPADYAAVAGALSDVEPGWPKQQLLIPPEL